MKIAFHTLGCKLNYSETSAISRLVNGNGYVKVSFEEAADLYVINTCSVTGNADKKCRRAVKKALSRNPAASVALIGCYAQLNPQEAAAIPGVDLVLGANEKFNLPDYLSALKKKQEPEIHAGQIKESKEFFPAYSYGDRTRSFLKVQDGCDYCCAYCTIPLARGRSRSGSIKETLESAREVARSDVKEVVLTGVNIGDFGISSSSKPGEKETFLDLIKELDKVEGIARFRISSIEPDLLTDEIIAFVAASEKFAPHFHIPLQSGSDKILKLMRRKYARKRYADRVELIKKLMPGCCIGADIITGFPGETEKDFLDTHRFLKELDISYLHVFPYSERNNTTAARMKDAVPAKEKNLRSKILLNLSEKKRRHFYRQHIGKEASVLFEGKKQEDLSALKLLQANVMHGFTGNYIKVKHPFDPEMVNSLCKMTLTGIDNDGIMKTEKQLKEVTL